MRLEALLFAAGLAVATAGTAAASPDETLPGCTGKSFIAETVCEAAQQARQSALASEPRAHGDVFAYVRAIMHPRSTFDWFRDRFDQLDSKHTIISSSTRPSTRPAATAPSDGHR